MSLLLVCAQSIASDAKTEVPAAKLFLLANIVLIRSGKFCGVRGPEFGYDEPWTSFLLVASVLESLTLSTNYSGLD